MKTIVKVVLALSALPVLTNVAPGTSWAVADGSLTSSQADTRPRPKPKVTPGKTKEGTSVTGTGRIPHRERTTKSATEQKSSTKKTVSDRSKLPAEPAHTKDNPPSDSKRRTEFKINIGICGRVQPDGSVPGPYRCQPGGVGRKITERTTPPKVVRPRPEDVTWEEVRSETKNIMFPGLSVKVQPNGRTLVNLETIVYTDDSKVSTTTVTLLGFPVVVEATPISYTWRFGDGSPALTTSTPGRPYPAKDITHKYMKRGNVSLTLTTNYAARFNVADTGWQYIEGTVPITGPATPLQIREAVPVLVDPDR
jgi:hypothetical protein